MRDFVIPGGAPKVVKTPCGKGCKLDREKKMCSSCGRSLEEIRNWSKYTDNERCTIMLRLERDGYV